MLAVLFYKSGKTQQVSRATFEMLLHRPEIAPQHLWPGALADRARLEVQQQFQFPLRENMPLNSAADQFLNELIERG